MSTHQQDIERKDRNFETHRVDEGYRYLQEIWYKAINTVYMEETESEDRGDGRRRKSTGPKSTTVDHSYPKLREHYTFGFVK